MRIIAGQYKSRVLKTLKGTNTRPMMDRMKESVFNSIGPYFDGGVILDLFGGSGALSLEAISRGADEAFIIDASRDATKIINDNVKSLDLSDFVHVFNMNYEKALKKFKDKKFDLIFLDPPYRLNIIEEIGSYLLKEDMLNPDGYLICHYVKGNVKVLDGLNLLKNYAYGTSEVSIYRK